MDGIIEYVPLSINPQLSNVPIDAHSNYSFNVNSEGNIKISGSFSSTPSGPINVKILDSNNSLLWEDSSQQSSGKGFVPVNFMNPNSKGSLEVVISNLGDEQTIVTGIVYDQIVLKDENDYEGIVDAMGDYIAYSVISDILKFVGVIFVIIGAIFFFKERRNQNNKETLS